MNQTRLDSVEKTKLGVVSLWTLIQPGALRSLGGRVLSEGSREKQEHTSISKFREEG